MRILHFSHKPVYPKIDGGCIAIADSLERLQAISQNNITHLTLSTHKHAFDIDSYSKENKLLKSLYAFDINTKLNPFSAFTSLIKGDSYNVNRFFNKQVALQIDTLLKESKFDVVWLESLYTIPYLTIFKKHQIPVVVRTHNVEHKIWENLSENCSIFFKRFYLKKLAKQLKKYELSELKKVDGIVCISSSDEKFFKENLNVVTTTVATSQMISNKKQDYSIADMYHLAAMDWLPNKEGLDWFIENVLPHLNKNIKLHIAGKSLSKSDYSHDQIVNHGEIDDADQFIEAHGICIIPLQSGSGIRMKVLQNLAHGKAIISTSKGVEGLNLSKNELTVIDDPIQFANALNELSIDISLRESHGKAARKYISDNFAPEKIEKQIIEFIEKI